MSAEIDGLDRESPTTENSQAELSSKRGGEPLLPVLGIHQLQSEIADTEELASRATSEHATNFGQMDTASHFHALLRDRTGGSSLSDAADRGILNIRRGFQLNPPYVPARELHDLAMSSHREPSWHQTFNGRFQTPEEHLRRAVAAAATQSQVTGLSGINSAHYEQPIPTNLTNILGARSNQHHVPFSPPIGFLPFPPNGGNNQQGSPTVLPVASIASPSTIAQAVASTSHPVHFLVCTLCGVAVFQTYEEVTQHQSSTCPARIQSSTLEREILSPSRHVHSRGVNRAILHADTTGFQTIESSYMCSAGNRESELGHRRSEGDNQSERRRTTDDDVFEDTTYKSDGLLLSTLQDSTKLSDPQCFMRKQIEAFAASQSDTEVHVRGRNKPVLKGQVGIRCVHCRSLALADRGPGAVYFPSSLDGVYQAAQNMLNYHLKVGCTSMPYDIRGKCNMVTQKRATQGGGKQFWVESLKLQGLIDTPEGIRFRIDTASVGVKANDVATRNTVSSQLPGAGQDLALLSAMAKATFEEQSSGVILGMVRPEDKPLVSSYLYLLFAQVRPCRLSVDDRVGFRRKEQTLGQPGLECKHCEGSMGSGRFFRSTTTSMAKNENMSQLHSHLVRCKACPLEIIQDLKALKKHHPDEVDGLKRGWKKTFFDRIMSRLHDQIAGDAE